MNNSEDIPIRVVCATRLKKDEFRLTLTGKSLFALNKTSPIQVRLYDENFLGLSELYNKAIEEVRECPCILIFIHDDVLITDFFWSKRVREGLKYFDIVGVVGNTRRQPYQPGWIMTSLSGTLDDRQYLSGTVGQGTKFPPEALDFFGPTEVQCKLIDGVFIAAYSETLHQTGLRFDPIFKFHFYDLDFCRSAEKINLKLGTIPLSIIHASYGNLNKVWHDSYQLYIEKWKN